MEMQFYYMRRSSAFKVHKVQTGYGKTMCHQRLSNRKQWVQVERDDWDLSPCGKCKGK